MCTSSFQWIQLTAGKLWRRWKGWGANCMVWGQRRLVLVLPGSANPERHWLYRRKSSLIAYSHEFPSHSRLWLLVNHNEPIALTSSEVIDQWRLVSVSLSDCHMVGQILKHWSADWSHILVDFPDWPCILGRLIRSTMLIGQKDSTDWLGLFSRFTQQNGETDYSDCL